MLAPDEIKRFIDLVVDHGLAALEMTQGDVRIRIEAVSGSSRRDPTPAGAANVAPIDQRATPQRLADPGVPSGANVIRAPADGIVHLAPTPGAPPFVSPGQRVQPEDTVCVIEVMKMFFPVTATAAGTIEAIRTESGRHVGFDEVLFVLS